MKDGIRKARGRFFLHSTLAVLAGCLCCITPLVLVLFGLASISTAVSVDNVLTGTFVWLFRSVGLLFVALALVVYFRRGGLCTLDAARRQRNRIINTVLLTLLFVIGSYIGFEYIVMGYWGRAAGLPWAPERWAYPAAGILLAAGGLLYAARFFPRMRKDMRSSAIELAEKGETKVSSRS